MIESVNNERIKNYAKLNTKKYRDEEGLFIVEGEHLVDMAKENGLLKEKFELNVDVSETVMKKLSTLTNVPRVLAIAKKMEEKSINGNILVLDDIQDPGNLGTIIRSAVAFGIDTIVASTNTVDVYNSKVVRASEGAIFNINYLIRDLNEFLPTIKNDYVIYTTNVNNGSSLYELKEDNKYAIIMGNEGAGVKDTISSYADKTIYIPISDKMESLNVGIATSIILYEFNK